MKNNLFFDEINQRIENIRLLLSESQVNPDFSGPIVFDTLLKEWQESYLLLLNNKAVFFDTLESNINPAFIDSPENIAPLFGQDASNEFPQSEHSYSSEMNLPPEPQCFDSPEAIPSPEMFDNDCDVVEPVNEELDDFESSTMNEDLLELEPISNTVDIPQEVHPDTIDIQVVVEAEKAKPISLVDQFITEDHSINQRFVKNDNSYLNAIANMNPLTDIRQGIGINDRFMFVRELFQNDSERYNLCVDQLNRAGTRENALKHIESIALENLWQSENEAAQKFIQLIYRRFKDEK